VAEVENVPVVRRAKEQEGTFVKGDGYACKEESCKEDRFEGQEEGSGKEDCEEEEVSSRSSVIEAIH
jgi:hypothetical protein